MVGSGPINDDFFAGSYIKCQTTDAAVLNVMDVIWNT
jgi:hypothetical protein